jgi:Mrp family chromosome partitioning ATPase
VTEVEGLEGSGKDTSARHIREGVAFNVDLMPLGKYIGNAAELIRGGKFQKLVDALKHRYEYVIIDTPPVLAGAESVLMANLADTHVLVASYHHTRRRSLALAVERLDEIHAPRVYGVFNRANTKAELLRIYLAKAPRAVPTASENKNAA